MAAHQVVAFPLCGGKSSFILIIKQTNKQMRVKKCFSAPLRSNISASRQNIGNLVGNSRDIKMRNLIAKFELYSFNTVVAF